MERLFWISLAGALGTGARYLVGVWAGARFGTEFPYGTLIVNLVGCFLMALVAELAARTVSVSPALRVALTAGFLGGLTTYSSFNYETTSLFLNGARGAAVLNFGVTVAGCFLAGWLGMALGRTLG